MDFLQIADASFLWIVFVVVVTALVFLVTR